MPEIQPSGLNSPEFPIDPAKRPKRAYNRKQPDGTVVTTRRARSPFRRTTPADDLAVAQMRGVGIKRTAIAKILGMSVDTVDAILKRDDVKDLTVRIREATRTMTLNTALQASAKAHDWVMETIDKRDAKSFDAVTRGIAALEKTGASASGENKPAGVQVAVINQQQSSDEARELIAALLAANVVAN